MSELQTVQFVLVPLNEGSSASGVYVKGFALRIESGQDKAMGGDRLWKTVERTSIILGGLGGAIGGVFAVLTYYKPEASRAVPVTARVAAKAAHVSAVPEPLFWSFLAAAILLLLTGWTMMAIRLRGRLSAETPPAGTEKPNETDTNAGTPRPKTRAVLFVTYDKIDPLTLREAACLWAGVDPNSIAAKSEFTGEPAARKRLIQQGVKDGHLFPELGPNIHESIVRDAPTMFRAGTMSVGDNNKFYRRDLIKFAETIGERPDFLFRPDAPLASAQTMAPIHAARAPISVSSPPEPEAGAPSFEPPRPKAAVLVLQQPTVEQQAVSGVITHANSIIVIRNQSAVDVSECRIMIDHYETEHGPVEIKAQFDPGGPKSGDYFSLVKFGQRRLRFTSRDLADVINEPPHKIPLEGGRFIEIGDNQRCVLFLRLTCNARRVTVARVEITTGEQDQIAVVVLEQRLGESA